MPECMYVASTMYVNDYASQHVLGSSILFQHFSILRMHMFMGLVAQMVKAMVASSSLVRGLGTLQILIFYIY